MKSSRKAVLFIIVLLVALGAGWLFFKEGTLPVDKTDKSSKIFIIRKGESPTQIIRNLQKEGLIRNRVVFYVVVMHLGIQKNIQAGDYRLSASMDAWALAKKLTQGSLDVWVTIVEGLRKEEIAQILSQELAIPEADFIEKAAEGFLFPDTYLIPRLATAETVITILTRNFNTKYTPEIMALAQELGLTERDVVILASLVEREAKFEADRQLVASVLLNRLKSGMPLQIDATVQYALGYQPREKSWWKKELTFADLKVDSPYNTYLATGLPPGPICNPGLSAIKAVVTADPDTDFLFYVSDSKGKLHFAETNAEHEKNSKKYLR